MNPIIKWTGGKRQEFKEIEDMIPAFDRYVEPFFGGGAVFFSLEPKKAMINDKSKDLIDFYRLVKEGNQEFKEELFKMVDEWERLKQSFEDNKDKVDERIELGLKPELSRQIISNIKSKLARIKKIEEKENKVFNQAEMYEHIETAFRSGYYMYRRGLMNLDGFSSISKKMANYYFVREFCYGSMFRFNSDGKFNIPYGGIAYNKKDFRKKVEQVFKAKELFCDTVIDNVDFEEFFLKHNLTEKDFVFLDPPYDSEFSEYDLNAFGKKDQERLANVLIDTKAKYILIIKNTDFIMSLYKDKPRIKIKSFAKKYMYNVRGRNSRDAEHLVIFNY